jgi:type VI secretion system protein ImpE
MNSKELFREGRLREAIQAAGAELRDDPANGPKRTFLFEMLCFAGEYERAGKQLDILAQENKNAGMGALIYQAALHAEKIRQKMLETGDHPGPAEARVLAAKINGQACGTIEDADPRIGPRIEVFAAGDYLWISFEHIASIEIEPPRRLRDLLWTPALLRTGPAFRGKELGEVLLPAIAAGSWRHADDAVRLGRATVWEKTNDGIERPLGQKMLLVDGEEFPFLEVRTLEFVTEAASQSAAP